MKIFRNKKFLFIALVLLVSGVAVGVWQSNSATGGYKTVEEKNSVYVRFDMEIFDKIVENYWQVVNEAELGELYRLAHARVASTTEMTLETPDRRGVARMLAKSLDQVSEGERKNLALNTGIIVLANLAPQGRSGLLSETQETAFRNEVNNINPKTGLAEPTVSSEKLAGGALYLDLSKISNTTLQEVANQLAKYSLESPPNGLIIDLRGNTGGALDFAKYFLSLFLGPNQYAYDLFQQGVYHPERTPNFAKVGYLSNLNDVAVLIDEVSQSTSELLAASFKRFRLGKVVGTQSKGWGTVENTFPLETNLGDGSKYSVLLVHSLTLRDDGEPIEGRGVDPDIDISDSNWEKKVGQTFSRSFATDLIRIINK